MEIETAMQALEEVPRSKSLRESFARLRKLPELPSAILLISAPDAEVARNFPDLPLHSFNGLTRKQPTQFSRQSAIKPELLSQEVRGTDLIVWIVSALKLFENTFAAAIDTAREIGVPVWVLITGMGFLGDEKEFRDVEVPNYAHKLPKGSTVRCEGERDPLPQILISRLIAEGSALALGGWQRQFTTLEKETSTWLRSERKQLTAVLAAITDDEHVSHSTFDACRVLLRNAVLLMKLKEEDARDLQEEIRGLLQDLLAEIFRSSSASALSTQSKVALKTVAEGRLDQLLERHDNDIQQQVDVWCKEVLSKIQETAQRVCRFFPDDAQPLLDCARYFELASLIADLGKARTQLKEAIHSAIDDLRDAWSDSFWLHLWETYNKHLTSPEVIQENPRQQGQLQTPTGAPPDFAPDTTVSSAESDNQNESRETLSGEASHTHAEKPSGEPTAAPQPAPASKSKRESLLNDPELRRFMNRMAKNTAPNLLYAQLSKELSPKLDVFRQSVIAAAKVEASSVTATLEEHLTEAEGEILKAYEACVTRVQAELKAVQRAERTFKQLNS